MPWRKAAAAGQSRVFSTRVNRALCCYIPHCGRSGASFNINAFVTDKLSLSWGNHGWDRAFSRIAPANRLCFIVQ